MTFVQANNWFKPYTGQGKKIHVRTVFLKRLEEHLRHGYVCKRHTDGILFTLRDTPFAGSLWVKIFGIVKMLHTLSNAPYPEFICTSFKYKESHTHAIYSVVFPHPMPPQQMAEALIRQFGDKIQLTVDP